MLRHRAAALADLGTALPASLEQLGAELAAHVRLEEREVFPLIERVMPTRELEAVAEQLEEARLMSSGQPANE
jgi:iron-sulfur cluster repair protein YtfE (RIC family)